MLQTIAMRQTTKALNLFRQLLLIIYSSMLQPQHIVEVKQRHLISLISTELPDAEPCLSPIRCYLTMRW
jgi:hypothetical protein